MADESVMVSDDLNPSLAARRSIQDDLRRSQQQIADLNHVASQVPDVAPAREVPALTIDATPPAELSAAAARLAIELQQMYDTESHLDQQRRAIAAIEAAARRRATLILSGIVVGVMLSVLVIVALIAATASAGAAAPVDLGWQEQMTLRFTLQL
jgi:hypothetical protein